MNAKPHAKTPARRRYKTLVVRMPEENHDALFSYAAEHDCPASVIVREAIKMKVAVGYQPIFSAAAK